ncbi:uncharacterized protein LOC130817544 [Amaranthus tricolor]|uniref:uncharacterized protein LOC130817544 n=1 Tax=Amaranthus tricolor TaxID=29722 RepID=UPI0025898C25|nr:uncharacterized protein LOC130817544 [Amaranthus tricolor]XP_057539288.1 uncharacterized protein LOC130817544 [Amaranthus tricolor]XP_057539289.1 uncharacterized protein LOC130817544 [Amaranthus tricolor]XP_057539290.1 uncharacterized protein LOC130817544 [Amaranthus tricolor]
MPLTSQAVDALGVVTISLVGSFVVSGLLCLPYLLYFHTRIQRPELRQLGYFNGPWIVRIILIALGIFWGFGEILRLSFFRRKGKIFHSPSQRWQEDICKLYILSNLGFTEPCFFLLVCFLLRASLNWRGAGILNRKWNFKTIGYVLLYCFPIFILNLLVILVAPKFRNGKIKVLGKLPEEFTKPYVSFNASDQPVIACTYPMLCTIFHGLFSIILITYLIILGRQMVVSVINKGLQRRVYILIFVILSFLPLRVLLLGFSVLARHEHFLFEALAFSGFLVLLCCVVVGIFMLVFLPVKDSLALIRGVGLVGSEGGRCYTLEDYADSLSLIAAHQSHLETSTATTTSLGRNSDASTKRGSISFRTMIKDETSSVGGVCEEEMNTLSPGFRLLSTSSPGSPASLHMKLPSS